MRKSLISFAYPAGCSQCGFIDQCGGLEQYTVWGCFEFCATNCSRSPTACDWVCPKKSDFLNRYREAEIGTPARMALGMSGDGLPLYVPGIRDGSRREYCVDEPVVAVRLENLLRGRGEDVEPVRPDGASLRDHLGLRRDATILVIGVQIDSVIERFWSVRHRLIPKLQPLGLFGMTIPNFSFFEDAPRTHTMFNIARMMRVTEMLSLSGIPVAPHVNALTREDWKYWTIFLRERPDIVCITKEFQTGLRHKSKEREGLDGLRRLQEEVGRDLHPIIVGGTRLLAQLQGSFRRLTLVDQTPFSKTKKCQRAALRGRRLRWMPSPIPGNAMLDDLLADNLRDYRKSLEIIAASVASRSA